MRETLGQLLGWLIVTMGAWFVALLVMAYGLGDILPWHWTIGERSAHLAIQLALIVAYARWIKPREERR
jgi:hypothetical protein